MSVLPYQLLKLSPPIVPCVEQGISNGKSFGLSSAGYDIRIAETIWLWPLFGRLAYAIEYFDMPTDIIAVVHDKSSWARRFVFVQNTVLEPGWKGYLTLELTRQRPWPVRIKAGMPIAQILFHQLVEPTEKPYVGKYQNQAAKAVPWIYEKPDAQCLTQPSTNILQSMLMRIETKLLASSVQPSEQKSLSISLFVILGLSSAILSLAWLLSAFG